MEKYRVTFYPDGTTVLVERDTTILAAALSAGVYINAACGGDGVCGKCKVVVRRGTVMTQTTAAPTPDEQAPGVYLACLTTVHSDLEVEIPPESRLGWGHLSQEEINARLGDYATAAPEAGTTAAALPATKFAPLPLSVKVYLKLPAPSLEDKLSDLERLYRQIEAATEAPILSTGLVNIRHLSAFVRSCGWELTATVGVREGLREVLQLEPGDTSGNNFGFCFDIGTTTITGQLIDLQRKEVLGTAAMYNTQIRYGSDIITRIVHSQAAQGLQELQREVVGCLNQIMQVLLNQRQIEINDVTYVLCAGNTTMVHLLLCIDPTHLRREPYVPTANFLPVIRAAEAGVQMNPRGLLGCVPGVSSYVGGDTTAGIMAAGLEGEDQICLLIDIGTNGEIVLGNREFLIACAASAGPAFEGSGVSAGMRAAPGAIQKVRIAPRTYEVDFQTIGDTTPAGICGSGYIELIAQMCSAGVIDKNGKIKSVSGPRIRKGPHGYEFVVATATESQSGQDIVISDADIDNLKRAKAAIYSATAALLRHMGMGFAGLKKIFIAGGFGTSLNIEAAIAIGLLPDIPREKFAFIGNSSLSGCRQMLLSSEALQRANEIARKVTYFELSTDPGYMDEYMAALFFPHTNLKLFPSLKL